jgi:hypothetical protein
MLGFLETDTGTALRDDRNARPFTTEDSAEGARTARFLMNACAEDAYEAFTS